MSEQAKEYLIERVAESLDSLELDELQALARMVRSFELRRQILTRLDRRRDRARRGAVKAALRELRDAHTWTRPQPNLTVIDGGED
jgi:hypothetical protein